MVSHSLSAADYLCMSERPAPLVSDLETCGLFSGAQGCERTCGCYGLPHLPPVVVSAKGSVSGLQFVDTFPSHPFLFRHYQSNRTLFQA